MKKLLPTLLAACLASCTLPESWVRPAMRHRLPHQLASVVRVETFKQKFEGTEEERDSSLNQLIGHDADSALASTWREPFFHCLARKGEIEVRGTMIVSFVIEPAEAKRFAVKGWGYFDAITTKDVTLLSCVSSMPELVSRMKRAIVEEAQKVMALPTLDGGARRTAADNAIKNVKDLEGQTLVDSFVHWVPDVLWRGQTKVPAGALLASGRFAVGAGAQSDVASLFQPNPTLEIPVLVSTTRRFAVDYLQWYHEFEMTYSIHLKTTTTEGVLHIDNSVGHEARRASNKAGVPFETIGRLYFDGSSPGWNLIDLRDLDMLKRYPQ